MDYQEIFHCCCGIKDVTEVSGLVVFCSMLHVLIFMVYMSAYRQRLPSPDEIIDEM